ncbi:hypothetical protein GLOIN_2v621761 [Rhizophagus clarus]|uniref:Uncharacterized protein n=1 Tax=Rhizophagus clarus TaxID=94130 RepID=A0A8H3LZL8_9GLOM|nr:hypothetical protein GLOIN_2v621761 [Rhizophagus clarus]
MDSKFSSILNYMISIQLPIIIICFLIELAKFVEFNKHDIQFKYRVFLGRVCHSMMKKRLLQSYILGISCFSLCWIMLIGIYTVVSYKELAELPITCPVNFPYEFPGLRHICNIHTINLISLWILGFCSLLTMICGCCSVRQIVKSGKNDENNDKRNTITEP